MMGDFNNLYDYYQQAAESETELLERVSQLEREREHLKAKIAALKAELEALRAVAEAVIEYDEFVDECDSSARPDDVELTELFARKWKIVLNRVRAARAAGYLADEQTGEGERP